MTYETPDGPRVAEGTATFASNDNGFVSWQYNGFGDNQRYETFVVKYDADVANDVVFDGEMSVYPNPTDGVLYFSDNMDNVQLLDVTGRVVYEVSEVVNCIDLTTLVSGTYILTAEKEGRVVTTKIVKN